MSQASSFLSSVGFRRFLARPPVAARGPAYAAPASSGLSQSTGWDDAANDSLVGEAVQFAQQRRLMAEQIAIELIQRPDLRQAPEPVQDFLLQVWSRVVAHARITNMAPAGDPGEFMALVPPLLWSVRRDAALRRPARLVEMVPGLLRRLREGLRSVGREPGDYQAFFRTLEQLHRPALQLCATRRHQQVTQEPEAPPLAAPIEPEAWLDGLKPGSWIELYSRRLWLHVRLDWVGAQGQQFMFRSQRGDAHTMTRRILLRLLNEGLVRLAPHDGPRLSA